MQFFFGVIFFLLAVLAFLILIGLHYFRKLIQRVRKVMTGDLDDEEVFRRMADKHYRGKNDPKFDKDYFKGTSSKGSRRPESNSSYRTTTTTAEGVTIIDDRPQQERQKIFEAGEGEYVDYEVVEN